MPERILLQHLRDRRAGRDQAAPPPATTTFQQPSGKSPVDDATDAVWAPPSDSIASRLPPARTKGFCRGFLVDPSSNRAVVYESGLERDFACMLMADRRVVHIHDQPPAVSYLTPDGKPHRHTFDFLAVTADGRRLTFAVKPTAKVAKSGIEQTLDHIREQAPKGFADCILLRTERHITKERAANARTILQARRGRNEADVEAVRAVAMTLCGSARLGDLLAAAGLGGRGWIAAVCLIDEGVLVPTGRGRIDYDSQVRMGGVAHV